MTQSIRNILLALSMVLATSSAQAEFGLADGAFWSLAPVFADGAAA